MIQAHSRSVPWWRRDWHVDHTAASVARRIPSHAALVVRYAAHGDGSDIARWGDRCGRRCGGGRRSDHCRRGWRARGGDHRPADECPSHEAGSRVAVVPVRAVVAAAAGVVVLYVGYGRRMGALRARCRGLPGSLVLAGRILALALGLLPALLSRGLRALPALLSRRRRSAGLALAPARCCLLSATALRGRPATALPATGRQSSARSAALTGEAAAPAASLPPSSASTTSTPPPLWASTSLTSPRMKTPATSPVPRPRHDVIFITWLPCQMACEAPAIRAEAAPRTRSSAPHPAASPQTSNRRARAQDSSRTTAPRTAARPWPACK